MADTRFYPSKFQIEETLRILDSYGISNFDYPPDEECKATETLLAQEGLDESMEIYQMLDLSKNIMKFSRERKHRWSLGQMSFKEFFKGELSVIYRPDPKTGEIPIICHRGKEFTREALIAARENDLKIDVMLKSIGIEGKSTEAWKHMNSIN